MSHVSLSLTHRYEAIIMLLFYIGYVSLMKFNEQVCGSVTQCDAVCRSVSQCVAVCRSVLQRAAVCRSVSQ